jgi:hypothetical protein
MDPISGLTWAPASRIARSTGRAIILLDPATGRDTTLWQDSTLGFSNPTWSPDGRHLALQVRDDVAGRGGFWLAAPGQEPRRLLGEAGKPMGWTPDGSAIFWQLEGSNEIRTLWLDGRRAVYLRVPSNPGWCRPVGPTAPGRFLCTTPVTISDAWLLEFQNL